MNDEWLSNPIHEDSPVVQPYTGSPYDPYDGDANPEPPCPKCKAEMDWVDCAECEGTGIAEYEDGAMELCGDCNGEGGDYVCPRCGTTGREIRVECELNQREE